MSSSAARRLVRQHLFPVVEAAWMVGFSVVGRVMQSNRRTEWWTPQAGGRIVIVAPHPDDETLGAGGVAALHVRAGDPVTAIVVTNGGASGAGELSRGEMVRRRAEEVRAAAEALGIRDLARLGLPEGHWDETQARTCLAPLLRDAEVVYAPSCVDYHPEHVRVAQLVADLVRPGQTVRVYELGVPLTPLLVNLVADIREVAMLKDRALAAFVTQVAALTPPERLGRYRAGFYGLPAVEVFWELPAEAYAQVLAARDWRRGACPFRGIRERPLSDPLSVFVGLRARAALRRAAELSSRS